MNINKRLIYILVLSFIIILFIIYYILNSCEYYSNRSNKYKLSIISIFKNETMILKNWLNHYIWQGIEHFYLIDNDSTDKPLSILQEYIDNGYVSYFHRPKKYSQVEHYQEIFNIANLKEKTKWLIVADLDEFWYSPEKLINVIDKYNDYNVIYSNWLMFGNSNNILQPIDVRVSNIYRSKDHAHLQKWIVKTNSINSSDINIHNINNTNSITVNDLIKLNHYPIPSVEYFIKIKMTRGDATTHIYDNIRNNNYFIDYNKNTDTKDIELAELVLNDYYKLNDWKNYDSL